MTCNYSSPDWFGLKLVTQKTGATSLSVFLGQDQAKLRAILKKHLCYRHSCEWHLENNYQNKIKAAELEFS